MDTYRYQLSVYCKDCCGVDDYGCFDGGIESLGTFKTIEDVLHVIDEEMTWIWVYTVYDGLTDTSWTL